MGACRGLPRLGVQPRRPAAPGRHAPARVAEAAHSACGQACGAPRGGVGGGQRRGQEGVQAGTGQRLVQRAPRLAPGHVGVGQDHQPSRVPRRRRCQLLRGRKGKGRASLSDGQLQAASLAASSGGRSRLLPTHPAARACCTSACWPPTPALTPAALASCLPSWQSAGRRRRRRGRRAALRPGRRGPPPPPGSVERRRRRAVAPAAASHAAAAASAAAGAALLGVAVAAAGERAAQLHPACLAAAGGGQAAAAALQLGVQRRCRVLERLLSLWPS